MLRVRPMIVLCLEAACILATTSVCILIFARQRDAHAPLASWCATATRRLHDAGLRLQDVLSLDAMLVKLALRAAHHCLSSAAFAEERGLCLLNKRDLQPSTLMVEEHPHPPLFPSASGPMRPWLLLVLL